MRLGGSGRPSADSSASAMALELGFRTRKRCTKECLAFFSTSSRNACFCPRCGLRISTRCPAAVGEDIFEQRAIFEIDGCVDVARQISSLRDRAASAATAETRRGRTPRDFPSRNRAGRPPGRREGEKDSRQPAEARHTRRGRPYRHPPQRRFSGALPFRRACAADRDIQPASS